MTLDSTLYQWIVGHRWPPLDDVMVVVSLVGRLLVWVAIALVAFGRKRIRPETLLQLALALILETLVTEQVLKPLVHRTRPYDLLGAHAVVVGALPVSWSFPSGHAAGAFAPAYVLARAWPAARAGLWLLAALVAYSRVYLGVHYPLDVIAGALVGVVCGMLVVGREASAVVRP